MKRIVFLFTIAIMLCFVARVSNAQQTPSPDDGSVDKGVYSNRFFGFSVTHPKDWVVHGEATNTRLREVGKERAASSGALSAASSEASLKNTYQLLTTFQYPMGSAIEVNPGFMLVAEKVSQAPSIVTGRDYLLHVRPMLLKTGVVPLNNEPAELMLAGQKFFRQDSRMQINGVTIEQSVLITVLKGYAIVFILSGKDRPTIDEMMTSVRTLKFASPPSISRGKLSPKSP
jgi:hypothetical protein